MRTDDKGNDQQQVPPSDLHEIFNLMPREAVDLLAGPVRERGLLARARLVRERTRVCVREREVGLKSCVLLVCT